MTDANENVEYTLFKLLIEQMQTQQTNNNEQNKSVSTVTTLWIILFGLIVIQKVFKYIGKPIYHHYSAVNTRHNSDNSDSNEKF